MSVTRADNDYRFTHPTTAMVLRDMRIPAPTLVPATSFPTSA